MASDKQTVVARGSLSDLARLIGRSRQAVSKLAKRKVFEVGTDGTVDLELARLAIANRVRQRMQRSRGAGDGEQRKSATRAAPPGDDEFVGYDRAKTRREIAEARLAELKLAEQTGELVRIAEVRVELARRLGNLRANLLQVSSRLAPLLATETDQTRIHTMLDGEIRQILGDVAGAG